MDREAERRAIHEGYAAIERLTGQAPAGWYCRYGPSESTRDLVVEHGGFLYDSNSYADDLPYYTTVQTPAGARPWLVVPYSLTVNDSKFWRLGLSTGEDFFQSMKETFDTLYEEGAETPKLMNVGLHCRIVGQPGRANGLDRFIAYAMSHPNVWFAGRVDVARTWLDQFPPAPAP
jgi:peptidoglycan/xylan/chitin deacetylase (PgdA/CDA1 family)